MKKPPSILEKKMNLKEKYFQFDELNCIQNRAYQLVTQKILQLKYTIIVHKGDQSIIYGFTPAENYFNYLLRGVNATKSAETD